MAKVKGFCGKSVVVRAENAGAWVGVLKAKNGKKPWNKHFERCWNEDNKTHTCTFENCPLMKELK